MNIRYWLDRATEEIRFVPDRKAVRAELQSHYEDRLEACLARGMSEYEAKKAAVAAMGDPAEIAAELGRIHSPWWGWLWLGSRWALIWMMVTLAIAVVTELQPWGNLRLHFTPYEPQVGDITTWANDRTSETLAVWEPEGSIEVGSYRITAPTAYLEHSDSFTYTDGSVSGEYYELTIWLKATTWQIWSPMSTAQDMILQREAVDSDGFRYGWDQQRNPEAIRSLFCSGYSNPFSSWFHVDLELPDGHVPDWVDIPIGYNGDVIRVALEEEVVRR